MKLNYSLPDFTKHQTAMTSHEAVCYLGVVLYLESSKNGGMLPYGAKVSFAKKIHLHHPSLSIKTAQNLVSIAWKCQAYFLWLIEIYRKSFSAHDDVIFIEAAAKAVSEKLTEELEKNGRQKHSKAIDEHLTEMCSYQH